MAAVSGKKAHVVAVAAPGQGHVKPLMSLCRQIAKHGIKVTFVNTQSTHEKIVGANSANTCTAEEDDNMVLASVPDGLGPNDNPNDILTLMEKLPSTLQESLPDLIERINTSNPNHKISCVIADLSFGWILDIAHKMGAQPVGFCAPSIASFAIARHIPNLIQQGYLDTNGSLQNIEIFKLSDEIPGWRKDGLPWSFRSNLKFQKTLFEILKAYQTSSKTKWLLCNSCYELEPAAFKLYPNFLPIGPLHLVEEKPEKSCFDSDSFYPEDESCLIWLDTKPPGSVVYVSFGSTTFYSQQQLDELALGLELSGRPFLWVVRRDLANGSQAVFPVGFLERVRHLGKIVEWAPQNKLLSHPAIACFMSHCGWNSTLEGASKGVPYLCWPYFVDQTHNESYVCDEWEIGLRIDCDENGMRSRYQINNKIGMLLSDHKFKENALKLKKACSKSVDKGGSSYNNLETFIDFLTK